MAPTLWLALWVLALPGCKEKRQDDCPAYRQHRRAPAAKGDAVVAEVNGRPIHASEVAHRAREDELTPRAAVQALIDDELMVQEAERLGLHRDPDVVWAGKQAAVWYLLRHGFEKDYTRKDVAEAKLQKVYQANKRTHFHRPEVRRFAHIYVNRALLKRGRKVFVDTEKDNQLRAGMAKIHATVLAAAPKTWQEFMELGKLPEVKALGAIAAAGTMPRDQLMKPFGNALWKLDRPGGITGVITTKFWHHVAFLVQIIPGTRISYEQARPEILERVWPLARSQAFKQLRERVRKLCPITTKPQNLPVTPVKDDLAEPRRSASSDSARRRP